jgi:hypothetical protein
LDVGHEKTGTDGAVSSLWAIDVDEYPPYHQQGKRPQFDTVLHQVRDPLKAISSLTAALPLSWDWVCEHTHIPRHQNAVTQAAEYWLHLNQICEAQADFTFAIESIRYHWRAILGYFGITQQYPVGVRRDLNHRPHVNLTWYDIRVSTPKWAQIMTLAKRYGYAVERI